MAHLIDKSKLQNFVHHVDTSFTKEVISTTVKYYPGTGVTYTPTSGASKVIYECNLQTSWNPDNKASYPSTRLQYSTDSTNYVNGNWTTITGWVSSENKEKWLCKGNALYLEEQVLNISLRSAQGFYESNSSTDYISIIRRRPWSSWPMSGTPQINKDGSGESGFSTEHPTGASRLLVMRLE